MANVDRIMNGRSGTLHTISKTDTVYSAIAKMTAKNIGSLVVLDGKEPCGIVTERDYMRRVALEGRSSKTTFVQEIMSTELICVEPDTDAEKCMALMTSRRIRHLPVKEGDGLVGIVSMGDIVKHLAQQRAQTIEELTGYIQGRYA